MKNTSLTIGFIAGLAVGVILTGYARADSSNKCQAVEKAYQIAFTHYRPKILKPTTEVLYPHELAGLNLAGEVAETFNVSCEVYP